MEQLASNKIFGGHQNRYSHYSEVLSCQMNFSVYLPKQLDVIGSSLRLPVLTFLAGLTCTDENFVQKAGAQKLASELGLIIVTADTSPRGEFIPDDPEGAYDFGLGAGFYLNATEAPWHENYRMYDYVTQELRNLIAQEFPVDDDRHSICGHSMGGHGALTIAIKNPDRYCSVSAFAPIVSPMNCPWGIKALGNYLGDDKSAWENYDSIELLKNAREKLPMLVDQGTKDQFLKDQLKPELLIEAARSCGYPLDYRIRDGYDHSYFFIASFIEEHLRFHAEYLSIDLDGSPENKDAE